MKKRLCWLVSLISAAVLTLAPSALAHEGHASCAEGAQEFTVKNAQSHEFGDFVSGEAQQGGVGDDSATLHEEGCEQR
jgi:hypothetical protein